MESLTINYWDTSKSIYKARTEISCTINDHNCLSICSHWELIHDLVKAGYFTETDIPSSYGDSYFTPTDLTKQQNDMVWTLEQNAYLKDFYFSIQTGWINNQIIAFSYPHDRSLFCVELWDLKSYSSPKKDIIETCWATAHQRMECLARSLV